MRGRPILDDQFQAEQVGEFQEPIDGECAGVRFDLGQPVLTDRQLGGQGTLRELGSPPARSEDLSQLGAVGEDLLHVRTLIGMGDNRSVSAKTINVKYL